MSSGHLEVRYAKSGDVSIAYRVVGEGERDLLFVHGFAGNLQEEAESPDNERFVGRLARFSRLITFDRRGTGLSDRVRQAPSLETRMDDLRAVLDAVGSERATLFGTFEAAAMCMLFAATYPERTAGLVLYNPVARGSWAPDYPWAMTEADWRRDLAAVSERWATPGYVRDLVRVMAPTRLDDEEFIGALIRALRLSASPSSAQAIRRMMKETDVRDALPVIRVPRLVLAMPTRGDEARFVAERIPNARYLEVPRPDYFIVLVGDEVLDEIERFVCSPDDEREPDTALARDRRPRRRPHRRARAPRRQAGRARGQHWRARRARASRRDPRLEHGQGSRRRRADRVRRSRHARAQGRAGRVAALRGRLGDRRG